MLDVVIYLCNSIIRHTFRRQEGKRANLKTGVTRKQSVPIIPKSEHSYPLIHTCTWCVSVGQKCPFRFGNTRFGICFFALLPTIFTQAVDELNLKSKNFKDLLTSEPFTRKDIITIQVRRSFILVTLSRAFHELFESGWEEIFKFFPNLKPSQIGTQNSDMGCEMMVINDIVFVSLSIFHFQTTS